MITKPATVFIIDDDVSLRRALTRLVHSAGMEPQPYPGATEFLQADLSSERACVVSDIRMNGMNGLELHRALKEAGLLLPVIFVTAHDTEETRAQAKSQGAVAYFRKPVDDQALLDAIDWALSGSEN